MSKKTLKKNLLVRTTNCHRPSVYQRIARWTGEHQKAEAIRHGCRNVHDPVLTRRKFLALEVKQAAGQPNIFRAAGVLGTSVGRAFDTFGEYGVNYICKLKSGELFVIGGAK